MLYKKRKRRILLCVLLCVCLVVGGGVGYYFGVYTRDFKVTKGDVFSQVYPGDFYEELPFSEYLQSAEPQEGLLTVDIRTCGAVPGRTSVDNSDAIQTAIDEVAGHGGGVIYVGGGEYTTGSIELKSGITLFIDTDAALVASHDSVAMDKGCLLFAENAQDITLTGGGKICGEGNFFSLAPKYEPKLTPFDETLDVWEMRQEYRYRVRFAHESKYGNLVRLVSCKNITIENFMLENSAAWTLELNGCDGVLIRDFVINNNRHIANTDGIDIAGSSNVTVEHCFISTGDDGIVLKNAVGLGGAPMQNITVRNCKITTCTNAFKIGTETSQDISNVLVEDCAFFLNDLYPGGVSGISLESADGAKVKNVTIRNIDMEGEACPLFISLNNRNRDEEFDNRGELSDIMVENIVATGVEMPVIITGTKKLTVRNVTLKDFDIAYAPGEDYYDSRPFVPAYEDTYPECNRMRNLNAYGLWARYADNVVLENFRVRPRTDTKRVNVYAPGVTNLQLDSDT